MTPVSTPVMRLLSLAILFFSSQGLACVLGNKDEARKSLDKEIQLGGDALKLQALENPDLQVV